MEDYLATASLVILATALAFVTVNLARQNFRHYKSCRECDVNGGRYLREGIFYTVCACACIGMLIFTIYRSVK